MLKLSNYNLYDAIGDGIPYRATRVNEEPEVRRIARSDSQHCESCGQSEWHCERMGNLDFGGMPSC